jgi:hypothetical protein
MVKFNTINKFNIKTIILALLILFIISHIHSIKQLLHGVLGRALLVFIVIYISAFNKLLGIASVLIIILLYNYNEYDSYIEGFESSYISRNNDIIKVNNEGGKKKNINKEHVPMEGFDILGMELNIKKGKQSKSIPVISQRGSNEDVLPSDYSNLNFSTFDKGEI